MNQGHLRSATVIIAIGILILFGLSVPRTQDIASETPPGTGTTEAPSVVEIRDAYKKGTHTITGSLEAPNACSTIGVIATSTDVAISLSIAIESEPGICLQVPTQKSFSAEIAAPPALPISVTVNGIQAAITEL